MTGRTAFIMQFSLNNSSETADLLPSVTLYFCARCWHTPGTAAFTSSGIIWHSVKGLLFFLMDGTSTGFFNRSTEIQTGTYDIWELVYFVISLPLMHFSNKLFIFKGSVRALRKTCRTMSYFYRSKRLFICLERALVIVPTTSYCVTISTAVLLFGGVRLAAMALD